MILEVLETVETPLKKTRNGKYELRTTQFHEFQIPNSQFQESWQFSASAISI